MLGARRCQEGPSNARCLASRGGGGAVMSWYAARGDASLGRPAATSGESRQPLARPSTARSATVPRPGASGPVIRPQHPLDLYYAAHFVELAHQRLQLRQVVGHEREDVTREAVFARATVGLADIDVLRA